MKDYEKMLIASMEQFIEENNGKPPWNDATETLKTFPHSVIVEYCYPTGDFACRWCWQQFGPYNCKVCGDHCSEYPACPNVLAIEPYTIPKSYTKDGVVHNYNFHTRDPGEHEHEGTWTIVWLGKTNYDYGFGVWCFKNEADRDKFVLAIPSFNLGENYNV